ncbi:DUF3823 domain-containing protein [Chitinophaga arvensicola]|uniref:DUF3823 domain-containing protein n=1 Tax=Chitinophaga arvensicola TaxID=29529 RepID=A0A1I0SCZ7_9BACT|nr:DUF3823 domain-containing protein [Chitinophaga arvensicola]SEW55150.1 Protein of unknown function [Chitinophaga arvensicola]
MQKIIKGLLIGLLALSIASCSKTDNYPGPNAAFKGRILDKTDPKNGNFLTETAGIQIKLEELSWSATPSPQTIPSKDDGTFEDTQLFAGHYRVTPMGGPFWPVAGVELDINKGNNTHDIAVTPYLKIVNLAHRFEGTTLVMTFKIQAPVTENLPRLLDVQSFVNVTKYVGNGATIPQYTSDKTMQKIEANWSDAIAQQTFEIRVPDIKAGRVFFARVGARVDDSYKQYNFSEEIQVQLP